MKTKLRGKLALRVVLPLVVALCCLAVLLGVLAGADNVAYALSQRPQPAGQAGRVPPLAAPSLPLSLLPQVSGSPAPLRVCASGCPYTTIQAAVDAADPGDLIQVAQGVYTDTDGDGYVVLIPKTLVVQGGYSATDWTAANPAARPTIIDGQNTAQGLYVAPGIAPTIDGFHIRNGSAVDGAGVYIDGGEPVLRRNRIYDNQANFSGGGVYIAAGTATLENNLVYDNIALNKRGGGVYVADGAPVIQYNVVYANQAGQQGGGLHIAAGTPVVVGTILAGNTALGGASAGGGVYVSGGAPALDYNDYWSNTNGDWSTGLVTGTNSLSADPLFQDAVGADFHLLTGSPCVDAGDPARYPSADYDGLARPLGSRPDIGAFESYAGTCFARLNGGSVYTNVQAAVNAASTGAVIQVAGFCTGTGATVANVNKALTLRGGYTLTNWSSADPAANPTILDGENARAVVRIGNVAATVEGFHIRRGNTTQPGGGVYVGTGASVIRDNRIYSNTTTSAAGSGGGVYLLGGSPALLNNEVYSNTGAGKGGGGVYIANGSAALVQGNDVYANQATVPLDLSGNGGGGIYIADGTILVEDNLIHDNTLVGYGGGGIYVQSGGATIRGNRIYANVQSGGNNGGGGIYVYGGSPTIEANAVYGNSASGTYSIAGGGGIYVENDSPVIRNNLIYENTVDADDEGGGVFLYLEAPGSAPVIQGNTIYGNGRGGIYRRAGGGSPIISNTIIVSNTTLAGITNATCDYCDIWGNTAGNGGGGTGALSADPLFVNPGVDFHLQASSPCRDTAHPSVYPASDYDGYARPFGSRADVGAYEFYGGTCFARMGSGQVFPTVQEAVDAAGGGDLIKVAGYCAASGGNPVADVSQSLTLRGGYTLTNWLTPTAQTVLDALGLDSVIAIGGSGAVTVDGFIVQGGNAVVGNGGGIYVASGPDVLVQNVVFYQNAAAAGAGLASEAGSTLRAYNNTFVSNVASIGAAIDVAGAGTVSNTIIVSNTGAAIAGATCAYCDIWGNDVNSGGDANSFSQDPLFVDFAAADLRLRSDSPCIYAGDPGTALDHDFEGDTRPLGRGYDVGADECALYPNVVFAPKSLISYNGAPGRSTVHTHYLTNTGGITDTFDLTHTISVSGPLAGWSADYAPLIALPSGASASVPVTLFVPSQAISGSVATVYLTATSRTNASIYESVSNTTVILWNPGVTVTPPYSAYLNPGTVITYEHTLLNTGNAMDSFTVTFSSARGWSAITPTVVADLDPDMSRSVWLVITVPATTPGGIIETVVITAVNSSREAWAVVTDSIEINHTPGDRYVATSGWDTFNNCLVAGSPCRTIGYAVEQAATGDTIKVSQGTYNERNLELNKTVTLRGGYTRTDWRLPPDPKARPTIVDAQGLDRVLYILGSPTVEGLILQNGRTTASGGGVYIAAGSPILRGNVISANVAGVYGGGIYCGLGTPTIEQNTLSFNAAYRGGGFASSAGTPNFWSNVVYENTADAEGGGVYVLGGTPRIWHDTIYGNSANQGGGVYLYGGSSTISNTIVANNTASSGGGIYNQGTAAAADYNDAWNNANGDYVGLSAGTNSIADAPIFVNAGAGNMSLQPESPCVDVGDATIVPWAMNGVTRTLGLAPDIGAYEFQWGTVVLWPDMQGLARSGDVVLYRHVLTYTGLYTDTFDLIPDSSQGLAVSVIPPSLTLLGETTTTITVAVTAPSIPLDTVLVDMTQVTARSRAYDIISDTVTDTTYVNVVPALYLEPDREAGSPPGLLTYTHTLTNAGNYTDSVTFTGLSSHRWGVSVPPTITLGPGMTATAVVSLQIPSTAVSGTVDTMLITATTMFSDMVNGVPISATVVDTTTVQPRAGVQVERRVPAPQFTGVCVYPTPDTTWSVFRVTNRGNLTDTFDVVAASSNGWVITVTDSSTVLNPPIALTLAPNEYVDLLLEVAVPAVPEGTQDTIAVTATSRLDSSATDGASYVIDVRNVGVEMDPGTTRLVYLEDSISYTHVVTNIGSETNSITFGLVPGLPLPQGWTISFDPQPLILGSGEVGTVTVTLRIPMDDYEATEEVWIQGQTTIGCLATAVVSDTIVVQRPGVKLDPDRLNERPAPGSVITYTHYLTNVGFVDDSYTIAYIANPAPAWPGWTAWVTPTSVPTLELGQSVMVTAVVTVPAGIPRDERGTLIITATSSYTDTIYDTATTRMIIPHMPNAVIVPDRIDGQAMPGETITYTHVVTNTGNVSDTFGLATNSTFGFSTIEPQLIALEVNESTPVTVTILLPLQAAVGEIEETEVIVTFTNGQVVANDFTLVEPIPGTRYVAPNGTDVNNNCLDPQTFAPCATVQHAVDQAAVGDEVRVAQGVYTDVHISGLYTQVVYLDKSVTLRGGYVITDWVTSRPAIRPTVLDADGQGRVIYVATGVTPTVEGFHLRNGYVDADNGAGVYIASGAVPAVQDNWIYGNTAAGIGTQGGGIYYGGGGSPVLQRNSVYDNAAEDGAGMYLAGGSPVVWNNVLYSNVAASLGGGLYAVGSPLVWNDTFYENTASSGGGLYLLNGSPIVSNTIIAGNSASVDTGGIFMGGTIAPVLDYNDYWNNVNGDWSAGVVTGSNSLSVDPLFADSATYNLRLQAGSPCVDTGDPGTTVNRDREGKPRPLMDGYDIGAYEHGMGIAKLGPSGAAPGMTITYTIVLTNFDASPLSGLNVTDTLHPYLEEPVALIPSDGEYLAATRMVSWTVSVPEYSSLALVFSARATDSLVAGGIITNVAWIDGMRTNEVSSEYRTCFARLNNDPTDYATVQAAVDASTSPADVVKVAGYCYQIEAREGISQVVYLNKTLTMRGGYTPDNWSTPDPAANPTILDAQGLGRVIYVSGAVNPAIEGLDIVGGDATGLGGAPAADAGGGIYAITATLTLRDSRVMTNTAGSGAGLYLNAANAVLERNVIANNSATGDGGGIYAWDSGCTLINNAVVDNQAGGVGSGLYIAGYRSLAAPEALLLHTTIARNSGGDGSGVYVTDDGLGGAGSAVLTNTILAEQAAGVVATASSTATLNGVLWYATTANTGGAGTIAVTGAYTGDPAFAADGYHLGFGTAALDKGVDSGISDDIDGGRRPVGGYELGADELPISLAVSKQVEPAVVLAGEDITYTITVTNAGDLPLTVTVTDTLPAQVTPSGERTWTIDPLAAGITWTQEFSVTVAWGYSGTLTNTVQVTSLEGIGDAYTTTSESQIVPSLQVSKQASPDPVQAGGTLTYTVMVTNTGNVTLTATIIDVLPAQVTPPGVRTWMPTLAVPGGTWTQEFTVTVAWGYSGTLTNTVEVTTLEGASGRYTTTTQAEVTPSLLVNKWSDPLAVLAGDTLTYTIAVTNTGNVTLTATITDVLPAQVIPSGERTWTSTLANTGDAWAQEFTVTTQPGYAGVLTNVVRVTSLEGASGVFTQTTLSLAPYLTVTKQVEPDPVQAGQTMTYTVMVTNTGTMALTVTVTDTLPAQVTPSGERTWTPPLLQPGETWTQEVPVAVNWGYSGTLTNVVRATSEEGASGTYTATTQALVSPSLQVSKQASPDPVQAGQTLTYTVMVTNTGNVTLTATITDVLPAQVSPPGVRTWAPTLAVPGGTWTQEFTVTVAWGYSGTLTNTVEVTTLEGASGRYTTTTQAEVTPSLLVNKWSDPLAVLAGDTLTYTVMVVNTGNVTLTATITDVLPAQVVPSGERSWTSTLANTGDAWTQEFTVTTQPGYAGVLTNVVRVTSLEGASGVFTQTTLSLAPYLTVTKQVEPDPVQAGQTMTYTVMVTNTGTMALTVTVTDTLPAQVTPSGERTWTPPLLQPGETWTQEVPVAVNWGYSGTLTNVVRATSEEGASGTYTATTQALVSPSLQVSKQASPDPVQPGETLTYTIIVTNTGNSALTATVTDVLPAQVSPPGPRTWTPVLAASGEVWTQAFAVTVQPGFQGILTNVVRVTSQEGASGAYTETSRVCIGLDGVTISGLLTGTLGTAYTFNASVTPPATSMPVTFTWEATDQVPVTHSGNSASDAVAFTWSTPGAKVITVTAVNGCGAVAVDTHVFNVQTVSPIYLPLVASGYRYAPDLQVVDVVVAAQASASDPDYVLVTIRNNGPAAVTNEFWVDLYVDPSRVPVQGDLWNELSSLGKAWLVRQPLAPGQAYTLDTRWPDDPANPDARYSVWPTKLPAGSHLLYARVDSYWRPSGMVIETNEGNNVFGPVSYNKPVPAHAAEPTPLPAPTLPAVTETPLPPGMTPLPRPTAPGPTPTLVP